ncbi:hypothetical protein VNI00_011891 [Paramarasmius palmivorus]|uniref:Chromo domain-containing protein n=1 Tax=Paramarasmius palmivorus TaxID=297713 RepID=A0AAW0C9L5_9AGAR
MSATRESTTRRNEHLDALDDDSALSSLSSSDDEGASTASTRLRKTISASTLTRKKKTKQGAKSTLSKVTVAGFKLHPTIAFDTFWYWCAERKAIDDRRRAGEPYPWTKDEHLREYYFCNSYRVLDRGCQFLVREVIEKGSQEPQEVVFRILLYDIFTKPETYELLQTQLGPLSWKTYNLEAYLEVLQEAHENGTTLYTGAFMKILSGPYPNYHNHLLVLEQMMDDDLVSRMQNAKDVGKLHEYLLSLPGMGPFTSYQLLLNLSYSKLFKFSANDYVVPCVGSSSGLVKLFGNSIKEARLVNRQIDIQIMRWMMETQDDHFRRLGIKPPRLGPQQLPLDLSDIEHSICEVDKYARLAHPKIRGEQNRTNLRRVYRLESARTLPPMALPKAWNKRTDTAQSVDLSSVSRALTCFGNNLVCTVEEIIKHRILDDGSNEFLVQWHGSGQKEDAWLAQQILEDTAGGPEALEAYRGKQFDISHIEDVRQGLDGREFLVFWVGFGPEDATWEPEESLLEDAPDAVQSFLNNGARRRRRNRR